MKSAPFPAVSFAKPLKDRLAGEVRAYFNDRARGETPVVPSDDGLFGPKSVAWRVHGDVTTMVVGGVAALLLQMLHPSVLAGVWDHSNFRSDMHGRLRRTARFIAETTYGSRAEATAAIDLVRRIHDRVGGTLRGGEPYSANDPGLLAWVHVVGATSFLDAWLRYAEPWMQLAEQDRYFAEVAAVGERLGADPVPRSKAEALRLIGRMRRDLAYDDRTREVAGLVLKPPEPAKTPAPLQALTMHAGVDLLPPWARAMHRLQTPLFTRPLIRTGTLGMAATLRWALH